MAKLLKLRRGTTSQHSSFTGAEGEVTVNTDNDSLVVHDGSTAGGHELLKPDLSNLPAGTIDNGDIASNAAIAGTKISPNFGAQNVTCQDLTLADQQPRLNFIDTIHNSEYQTTPQWFKNWENIGLISWSDKNNDGIIQYGPGKALENTKPIFSNQRGENGERVVLNKPSDNNNEIYIDRDIMVLANPEIASLPNWVIALVAAGALAAALSTAAGLLLVISSAISHDLMKKI